MHSLLFQPTIQSLEIISVPSCSCRDDITSTLCDPDRTNERTPLLASDHPENRPPAQHRLRIREVAIRSREALLAFASSLQRVPPITWQFACAIGTALRKGIRSFSFSSQRTLHSRERLVLFFWFVALVGAIIIDRTGHIVGYLIFGVGYVGFVMTPGPSRQLSLRLRL